MNTQHFTNPTYRHPLRTPFIRLILYLSCRKQYIRRNVSDFKAHPSPESRRSHAVEHERTSKELRRSSEPAPNLKNSDF